MIASQASVNCTCNSVSLSGHRAHDIRHEFSLSSSVVRERILPSSNVNLNGENLDRLRTQLQSNAGGYLVVFGVFFAWAATSLRMLFLDCREVYVRETPSWMFSPPEYSFRWRFSYHIRKRHSVMSLWHVVAGRSRLSRVQLVMTLFNQVLVSFASVVMWYDVPMCYVETELIAWSFAWLMGLVGSSVGRWLLKKGHTRNPWTFKSANKWEKILEKQRTAKPTDLKQGMRASLRCSVCTVEHGVSAAQQRVRMSVASVADRMSMARHSQFSQFDRESDLPSHRGCDSDDWQSSRPSYSQPGSSEVLGEAESDVATDATHGTWAGLRSPAAPVVGMLEIESEKSPPPSPPAPQQHPGEGLCLSVAPSATSGSRRASSYYSANGGSRRASSYCHLSEAADNSASSGHIQELSVATDVEPDLDGNAGSLTCSRSDLSTSSEMVLTHLPSAASSIGVAIAPSEDDSTSLDNVRSSLFHKLAIERASAIQTPRPPPDAGELHMERQVARHRSKRAVHTFWISSDKLHRVQDDWVLLVVGAGSDITRSTTTQSSHPAPGVTIPVLRIGVPFSLRLPRYGQGSQSLVLVHISREDLPQAWAALSPIELSQIWHGPQLKGGGHGAQVSGFAHTNFWLLFAWLYTLTVNFWGLSMLLFAYLVVFPSATAEWRRCVLLNFGCSLVLSWFLSDVLLCAVIACLPGGSRNTRTPLDHFCAFLGNLCEPFDD